MSSDDYDECDEDDATADMSRQSLNYDADATSRPRLAAPGGSVGATRLKQRRATHVSGGVNIGRVHIPPHTSYEAAAELSRRKKFDSADIEQNRGSYNPTTIIAASELQRTEEEKLASYHSIVYYFFVTIITVGFFVIAGLLIFDPFKDQFNEHRYFVGFILLPIYFIIATAVFLTRRNYMLNNAATHAFAMIMGYILAFVSFMTFGQFVHAIKASGEGMQGA